MAAIAAAAGSAEDDDSDASDELAEELLKPRGIQWWPRGVKASKRDNAMDMAEALQVIGVDHPRAGAGAWKSQDRGFLFFGGDAIDS